MKIWQKILLLIATIILIAFFIHWWMSYEPMKIIIKNERNETINVSIILFKIDANIYNKTFSLKANESIVLENITNMAGSYYIKVGIDNMSIQRKIKYGKYYEIIEVIIGKDKIEIKNEREARFFSICHSKTLSYYY